MPPQRFALPSEVPGLAARRIAADILDGVLHKRRTLDEQLDGAAAHPGLNTLSRHSEEGNLLALHPTVKPVALVADALLDCSDRGDIVLDSFLGSGSTLIAAERVGRICRGVEIEPRYVDVAIRRWQNYTGDDAIQVSTGRKFNEIAEQEGAIR